MTKPTCNCEEMTCKIGCNRRHTHHGYHCEKCKPELIQPMADTDEALHEADKQNDLLNTHFEEQRIHDLKIGVDKVMEEVWRMYENEPDHDEAIWLMSLNNRLRRFKTLL